MIWNKCYQIVISFHLLAVYGGSSQSQTDSDGTRIHIGIERKSDIELNGVPVSF